MAQCTGTTKTGNQCRQKAASAGVDPDRCERHPRKKVVERGANALAVERTLAALESDQHDVDAALAQAARSLAAAVDENPQFPNLWSRYIECLRLLLTDDEVDEETQGIFQKYAA